MINAHLDRFATHHALSIRPSKTRLHRLLKNDLKKVKEKRIAADIAAQDFMNLDHFENRVYFGVDISEDSLRSGVDSLNENLYDIRFLSAPISREVVSSIESGSNEHRIVVAVKGDILSHDLFPDNSIDVLVSTNTLIENHIDPTEYHQIIKDFTDYVSQDGCMFFNLADEHFTDQMYAHLRSSFRGVDVTQYSNRLSNTWENYLQSEDGHISLSNNRIVHFGELGISLSLGVAETLYLGGTTRLYIRCKGRL